MQTIPILVVSVRPCSEVVATAQSYWRVPTCYCRNCEHNEGGLYTSTVYSFTGLPGSSLAEYSSVRLVISLLGVPPFSSYIVSGTRISHRRRCCCEYEIARNRHINFRR